MKNLLLVFTIFLSIQVSGQVIIDEVLSESKVLSNKIVAIQDKIDSLKTIQSNLKLVLDSIKVAEFKSNEHYSNEHYVVLWDYKELKGGDRVSIVKAEKKTTLVNTPLLKNYSVPTFYLEKEADYLIKEKEKKEKAANAEKEKEEAELKIQKQNKAKRLALEKKNEKRKNDLILKYGKHNAQKIIDKKIWIGMTEKMLIESWGSPTDINRTVNQYSVNKQYVYGSTYVYVENGIVVSWQD